MLPRLGKTSWNHRILILGGAILFGALPAVARAAERKLEAIVIAPSSVSMIPGRTQSLTATGVYSDDTTVDLTASVLWRARDSRIATVDAGGTVTAVASGRTEISATLEAARLTSRKTARIVVPELDALGVEPAVSGLRVGHRIPLKAIGTYEDGTTGVDLTSQVLWSSKKRSVVQIERDESGQPFAVGVAKGETNVVAKDPESGLSSSSTTGKIAVVGTLLGVTVAPDTRIARVGERVRFKAVGTFEKGMTADVSSDVAWTTSDQAIGTIDEQGRATGVALGSTRVTATDRETGIPSSASAADGRLDVAGDMTSLQVKPTPLSMALGTRIALKASALFTGVAKSVNATTKVEWRSSDSTKVAVDRVGMASCLAAGTVAISARDPLSGLTSTQTGGDAMVRCGIPVVGLRVTPDTLTLRVGKSKKVKAYLVYADDSRDDVTKRVSWSTSDPLVATVDLEEPNIGRVNSQAPGQATISVEDPVTGLGSPGPGGASLTVTVQ